MECLTLAVLVLVFTQNNDADEGQVKAAHEPLEQCQVASFSAAAEEKVRIINKHDILHTHLFSRRPYQKTQ
jgi:hypothetical protein